jgi:hypothetical protein
MTIKDIDTSKLLFDPKGVDFSERIKDKIPEFANYKGKVPDKKVFTWVAIMYDIYSPLWREIGDYYERKRVCAEIADFPQKKGRWTEDAEQILMGSNEEVNAMVVEYIARFGMPEIYQLVAHLSLLSSETRKTISFKGNKDSIKIITETGEEIRRLTRVVFHSGDYDEITSARNALYAKAEKERLKLRPEDVVRLVAEEGDLPDDFNPYGDYKVEKSKFVGDAKPE